MKIEYDPDKNEKNIAERGLSFEMLPLINRNTALIWQDERQDYGEERFAMLGEIEDRLYSAVFCVRARRCASSASARPTEGRSSVMKKKPLIDENGEMREVTAADLKKFRPATEVLSPTALALFADGPKRRGRGPGRKPAKVQVTVRLDPDIAAGLAAHPGWRQEANQVWRNWLSQHAAE